MSTTTEHTKEPWWPCHPMGGTEIFRDAETNEPMAKFSSGVDCERAILCVNACAGIPSEDLAEITQRREECARLRAALERARNEWAVEEVRGRLFGFSAMEQNARTQIETIERELEK